MEATLTLTYGGNQLWEPQTLDSMAQHHFQPLFAKSSKYNLDNFMVVMSLLPVNKPTLLHTEYNPMKICHKIKIM